jgi:hypothetical protein
MSKKQIVRYETFSQFYPFYLTEHQHPVNRALHFFGTTVSIVLFLVLLSLGYWKIFYLCIVPGFVMAICRFVSRSHETIRPIYSFLFPAVIFSHGLDTFSLKGIVLPHSRILSTDSQVISASTLSNDLDNRNDESWDGPFFLRVFLDTSTVCLKPP